MAITTAICNSFKKEILEGVHESTDTYKIALYTNSATLGASTTAYSATHEVANGSGYTTGGATLTGLATGLDGSTAYLTFSDPQWTEASITARGCLIYNSSQSNKAVAVFNFGQDVTSTNGTFTVDFPAAGPSSLIRIA